MTAATSPPIATTRPDVFALLQRLDGLLKQAVARQRTEHADGAFRGIYVSDQEVERVLELAPGAPLSGQAPLLEGAPAFFRAVTPVARVTREFRLDAFDHAVLLLALAPELDLRYERIYAYLQDDVTRRRPTVDLALQLFAPEARGRIDARARFAPDAALMRSGLVRLGADPTQVEPPLIAQYLQVDERVVRALLGNDGLDPRLSGCCRRTSEPPRRVDLGSANDLARRLPHFVASQRKAGQAVRLVFAGPATEAKHSAASSLAATDGEALLAVDLARKPKWQSEPAEIATLILREARLSNAVIFVSGLEHADDGASRLLCETLDDFAGTLIVAAEVAPDGTAPDRFLTVEFGLPPLEQRTGLWRRALDRAGLTPEAAVLGALAQRFALAPEQIEAATECARIRLEWQVTATGTLVPADIEGALLAAARRQTPGELAQLTAKQNSAYRFDDLVLPPGVLEKLQEICARVAHSSDVFERARNAHFAHGRGVTVLFAGASGTGKTMAAQVIANELDLDLFRIDLSAVTSKYIGETEKNLERIFRAAARSNAVLLFDEADSLFGKRSEVRDAHDRYANLEISYLLQRMEQYEGASILTTNLRGNLDEAFQRRLAFTVQFPFPEENERLRIWQRIWPPGTELAEDVDLERLANRFRLSGGNIRNVALGALFRAAPEQRPVELGDVLHALGREYEKVGKTITTAELAGMAA